MQVAVAISALLVWLASKRQRKWQWSDCAGKAWVRDFRICR
jgi:hypothetical protein